jgi:hypothetical protein
LVAHCNHAAGLVLLIATGTLLNNAAITPIMTNFMLPSHLTDEVGS